MNQIVTNPKNSKTIMQVKNHKLKARLVMRMAFLALCALIFVVPAKAQRNVLMQNGSTTLTVGETVNFYDSHGPSARSAADGNKMGVNYWDKWYVKNEGNGNGFVYTFNAPDGYDVKVEFKTFEAYGWSDAGDYTAVPPVSPYNCASIGEWAFRVNDDWLYAYEGTAVLENKLIGAYTGNTEHTFSIIAQGSITFKFVSNAQFQEEGWYAEVKAVPHSQFVPTAPFIRRSTCSDDIELVPTTLGATMSYTTNGQTPAPGITYDAPIDWPEGNDITVKAIATLNGVSSAVATATFTDPDDRIPHINTAAFAPTIGRVTGENMVSIYCPPVPSGLNETFFVSYTTDGSEPSRTNGTIVYYTYTQIAGAQATYYGESDRTYTFEWNTPNTTIKAKVFAFSCTNDYMESPMGEYTFGDVYVPDPTITFTPNTDPATGSTTLSCSLQGATIYYTIDGSDPTTSSTVQTYNAPFDVPAGTTVKAYATVNQTGYTASNTVSDIYVPTNSNGEPQNGVYGGVVLLDDREPHTWSYYTNNSPIHRLQPRDIKITYFGNGQEDNNMTTTDDNDIPTSFGAKATGVAVNVGEAGDQFVYLKTLEAANVDGSGNYPYTMIPNPFQVRPVNGDVSSTTTTNYQNVTTAPSDWSGTYLLVYTSSSYAFNGSFNNNYYGGTTSVSINNGVINYPATGAAELTLVQTGSYYYVLNGNNYLYVNRSGQSYTLRQGNQTGQAAQWTLSMRNGYVRLVNRSYGSYEIYYSSGYGFTVSGSNYSNVNLYKKVSSTVTTGDFRGFYAWRVKSLSEGLTIQRANGNPVNEGGIIDPDEEIKFVTSKEEGNEVEFEALWAKAYVSSGGSLSGYVPATVKSARERNFFVLNDGGSWNINGITIPATYTAYLPNGTNGNTSSSITTAITCSADVRIENIKLDFSNGTMAANGHNLFVGRGVTGTVGNVIGYTTTNGNTAVNTALAYTIRIESGTINNFYLINNTGGQFNSTVQTKAVIGCDYDRAKKDNSKLDFAPSGEVYGKGNLSNTYGIAFTSNTNRNSLTFDWCIKSGRVQHNLLGSAAGGDESVYLGHPTSGNNAQYTGKRRIIVEGGEISSIAGGVNNTGNNYSTYAVNDGDPTVLIRMKGGTVRGAVYGAGEYGGSSGETRFVFTGGKINGWISGGCNGTHADGGELFGETYIYFGGNAEVGNTNGGTHVGGTNDYGTTGADGGIIFGAGCGILPTNGNFQNNTVGQVTNSTIVVADNSTVYRDVYGGGNYGFVADDGVSNIHVLGGEVKGNVYGGANSQQAQTVNITMTDGKVNGNIYGGSNSWGTTNDLATINVTGGTVTNVFGGGYGSSTIMASDVFVNIGGTALINNSVYGGGEQGVVGTTGTNANTDVTIAGGTVKGSVYGAGLGTTNTVNVDNPTAPQANANIYGNTTVLVSGGTVEGSVFGGGENGSVAINVTGKKSTVGVTGGTINGSVFGGGSEGFTNGNTLVNLSGGVVKGSVFGGAFGKSKLVYVNGTHTVNVMGGDEGIPEIRGSVYGGSRLANDGNSFTLSHNSFTSSTASQLSSVVNISGARIKEHVYASGYYGRCFGSVYVNIGENAINNTTVALSNNTADKASHKDRVFIEGSVWAGSDWGVFSGSFGAPTVSGNSNIFLDGTGYNVTSTTYTDSDYMGIGMSILGCGTSCDAGKANRNLLVRNYGTPVLAQNDLINPVSNTSRSLNSIQRFKNVTFDKAHLTFTGQGRVNSLNTTEKYSIYSIVKDDFTGNVYVANGSTLIMNYPASELNSFRSVTCSDPYVAAPSYSEVTRDALYGSSLNGTSDNKIRVNGGSFVEVKYAKTSTSNYYGELQGYFHMMADNPAVLTSEATCAYARPKQAVDSQIASTWDNPNDGGFLSYDPQYNTWNSSGHEVGTGNYQLPYENHAPTRGDSEYFRIWRFGGNHHTVEGVVTVQQVGHSTDENYNSYQTVAVTIQLPAWRTADSYYRFDRTGDVGSYFSLIDYGVDVMTFNAANTNNTDNPTGIPDNDNHWMYYNGSAQATGGSTNCPEIDKLSENPDMNFGLVIMPGDAMTSASNTVSNYIICSTSDSYIAENMQYNCSDYLGMPTVTFIITYRNDIHSNTTWDPITIPLVQCTPGENGAPETETEFVNVSLTINTMTDITSTFKTQVYAIMNGGTNSHNSTLQTITLPTFNLLQTDNMDLSTFTVVKAEFEQAISLEDNNGVWVEDPDGDVDYKAQTVQELDINSFGLTLEAVMTPDNSDDWRDVQPAIDGAPGNGSTINKKIAESGGRTAVALGFNLYYSDVPKVQDVTLMGTVTFTIKFNNYADGDANHEGTFTVEVEVYRKGPGVNFFVDGVNGKDEIDNQKHRGHYPNFAAKTVEFVLSRLGFTAGDNIFIVNQVDVSKNLKYDGSRKQNNINIWRYPGNHTLKSDAPLIIGNQDNLAYTGLLFNLKDGANLKVIGAKIDGMYAEATLTNPNLFDTHIFPRPNGATLFNGEAAAPIFKLNEGASLMMNVNTRVQNNYNKAASKEDEGNAGGVYIASGAVLAMNDQTKIVSNYNDVAGGVYMDGSMIVSDDVEVNLNKKSPTGEDKSNVWLTNGSGDADDIKVVQIGNADQSSFGPLSTDARIGIDKNYSNDAYLVDDYMPVVYTEMANSNYVEEYLQEPFDLNNDDPLNNDIIFHDLGKYKLTKYTPDNYLYWLSTWVTFQDHQPNHQIINGVDEGGWDGIENIHTPQQLAWFISLVNGENGATASTFAGETVNITADITMDGHIWVPVGTPNHPFKGTFEGNGHVITDMYGSLIQENMGMFGYTDNATIQNAVMETNFTGTNDNLGTAIGKMNGGVLCNVEGAGNILNKLDNCNMGGLVGYNNGGTIHSTFAVPDMTGGANMGGLVGKNAGNLYNSYSNVDFAKYETQTSNMFASGLVAENAENCVVENCYVIEGKHSSGTFYSFAKTNDGDINFCYVASTATASLVSDASTGDITGEGTYGAVKGRKELGYMYGDNKVTKTDANDANAYITAEDKVYYADGRIDKWRGLLSTLNQWVAKMNGTSSTLPNLKPFTPWFRSTSSYLDDNDAVMAYINGDLPVLGFPKDNCLGNLASEDGKMLRYSAYNLDPDEDEGETFNNGLDDMFTHYSNKSANIFLYGNATDVTSGSGNANLFINEDAVLLQFASSKAVITATVGVTFDNSDHGQHAVDNQYNVLTYDWHMMSTPLQNAAFGITYKEGASLGYGQPVDIDAMVNGYFPNGLPMGAEYEDGVKWDFYTYYEPQYHWINFKRSINNHWHYDVINHTHPNIPYAEEDQTNGVFTPGKGYMMAISQDSYMNSTGTLNNGNVSITITNQEPDNIEFNKGWNLVGNPYQAYLNLYELGNLGYKAYTYDADQGLYIPFVMTASDNTSTLADCIHPHQAFFVYCDSEGGQKTLTFKPSMATTENKADYSYFRGDKVNYPLVNIYAENERGNRDMTIIEFNRPEIGGAEEIQGLRNANFHIAASLEGQGYGLLFAPEGTDRVPVRFYTHENGTFTLTWETMHGNFTSLLLVDNMTGTITDMLRSDHYSFDATTDDYASRFYITFTVTDVEEYNEGEDFAWFDGSEWVINGKGNLDVVDVLGRTIYSTRLTDDQNRVNLNGVAKGVYLLRVSEGNKAKVQKVVVR